MHYQTTKSVISKVVNDEFIVVHLDTGRYHYFNKETESFLRAFVDGSSLDQYVTDHQLDASEKIYLQNLCDTLLQRRILAKSGPINKTSKAKLTYHRPKFLRDGEKTLDQISFASP